MRKAWDVLAKRARSAAPLDAADALREWIRDDAPSISASMRTALGEARGVRLFLETDPSQLPLPTRAIEAFRATLERNDLPSDPVDLVALVDKLCRGLAVYTREDDCCPECQYDLELFVADGRCIDVCGMDHCFESPRAALPRGQSPVPLGAFPASARPARRDEVRAHFPDARLA